MSWTNRDEEWWQDERRKIGSLTKTQTALVEWLSRLPWTHIYHQTFRSEITDGQSAISVGSRFLAEYASSSRTTAAMLVAERHPQRRSRGRRSAFHQTEYTGNSAPSSGRSRTSRKRRLTISPNYEGRQGRLYHLHGLLAGPSTRFLTATSIPSTRRGRQLEARGMIPYWKLLKDAAWLTLGAARIWRITVSKEVAATIYAVKYILKGMKEWPESATTYRDKLPWEIPQTRDDWQMLDFSA